MERKIIYNLIYACNDLSAQQRALEKLKRIPKEVLEKETIELLYIIDGIASANKLVTPLMLNTFFRLNQSSLDLDSYLWEVDEEKDKELDLDIATTSFLESKIIEANEKQIEVNLDLYRKTKNPEVLRTMQFLDTQEEIVSIPIQESVDMSLEHLRKIKDKENHSTINFSHSFFNTQIITKGFEPGELIILAARPGVGKSAFTLALINDISKQGKKVLLITLEMTAQQVITRMLTSKTGIPNHIIKSQAQFTDDRYAEFVRAGEELKKQNITIIDEAPYNFVDLREIIRKEHKKNKLDIVFIDYIGLIDSFDGQGASDLRTTITRISRALKLLAKELEIPIFALQQTSRSVAAGSREDASFKELQLTDLRDSGSLEQDANKVFLLWYKEPEDDLERQEILNSKYKLILSIAKNRDGQSNQKVLFEFNRTIQRIREIAWLTKPSSWVNKND